MFCNLLAREVSLHTCPKTAALKKFPLPPASLIVGTIAKVGSKVKLIANVLRQRRKKKTWKMNVPHAHAHGEKKKK